MAVGCGPEPIPDPTPGPSPTSTERACSPTALFQYTGGNNQDYELYPPDDSEAACIYVIKPDSEMEALDAGTPATVGCVGLRGLVNIDTKIGLATVGAANPGDLRNRGANIC